ncbi:hypothetical protein [uncultured Tateyamaria sp.]|uniref:hypothetical protein n=1 Tax=uncultured Tateyamaria sp. TaxID=455651 RepID=UPI002620267B|nr:hypothetical protein [uncultured Tateyamaria sp.]
MTTLLVLVRFHDAGWFFNSVLSLSILSSGYGLLTGSFFVVRLEILKVNIARFDASGGHKLNLPSVGRDVLARAASQDEKPVKNHPGESIFQFVFGIITNEKDLDRLTYEDVVMEIEGAEARSILATIIAVFCFILCIGSFVYSSAWSN